MFKIKRGGRIKTEKCSWGLLEYSRRGQKLKKREGPLQRRQSGREGTLS